MWRHLRDTWNRASPAFKDLVQKCSKYFRLTLEQPVWPTASSISSVSNILASCESKTQLTQIWCVCFIFPGVPSIISDPNTDVQDRRTPPRASVPKTGAPLRTPMGPNSSMCCAQSRSPEGRGAFILETQLCRGKQFITVISYSGMLSYQRLPGFIWFVLPKCCLGINECIEMLHPLSSKYFWKQVERCKKWRLWNPLTQKYVNRCCVWEHPFDELVSCYKHICYIFIVIPNEMFAWPFSQREEKAG